MRHITGLLICSQLPGILFNRDMQWLKNEILQYLSSNAADVSSSEVSVKIMKSIDEQTPNRITELPYILKKHREVAPAILKRKAIGSLSNCAACHKTADKGDFEDDGVVIPN